MATIARVPGTIKSDPFAHLGGAQRVNQLFAEAGHRWRKCFWDPATTLAVFVLQILNKNAAISALSFLAGIVVKDSSYCGARMRLPVWALAYVVENLCKQCRNGAEATTTWLGRRVFVADATSATTPDEPKLQKLWPQPSAQKPGCGFPAIKLLGMLDLVSGMIVHLTMMCLNVHEMSVGAGMFALLQAGDVLLADRGFCSFVNVAMVLKYKADAVFRMHQRIIVDFTPNRRHRGKGKRFRKGIPVSRFVRRLGHEDQIVAWPKPEKPDWMSQADYDLLPASIDVRELRYRIVERGRRTRVVTIATTLLDSMLFSKQEIAKLYGLRWEVETNFRHLKSSMGMECLKCKTVEGVMRELLVFVLVYNLIRSAMTTGGQGQNVDPNRISFIHAVRWLRALYAPAKKPAPPIQMRVNPIRPGRWHPRVIKRRIKPYDLMNKPRSQYAQPTEEKAVAA